MKSGSGKVKFFNDPKGYGFIILDDGETEIFVHQTKIKMEGHRTLHEHQPVRLQYYKEEKGWKAESVEPDLEWAKTNVKQSSHDRRGDYNDRGYGGQYGGGDDRYYDRSYGGGGYDSRGGYGRGGYDGGYSSGGYDRGYGGGYGGGGYGGGGGYQRY